MSIKFELKVMHHFEADAESTVYFINNRVEAVNQHFGCKEMFFYNGEPFYTAKLVEVNEWNTFALFKFAATPTTPRIFKDYYEYPAQNKAYVNAEDITGLDLVDVYFGKKFVGTFCSVTTK